MSSRKIPQKYLTAGKPEPDKFARKRFARNLARREERKRRARKLIAEGIPAREALGKAGKKPLVQPLTMLEQGVVEREIAGPTGEKTKRKEVVLLDGKNEVPVPLAEHGRLLQGVYRGPGGRIIVARTVPNYSPFVAIKLYEWKNGGEQPITDKHWAMAFFAIEPTADIAHMYLPKKLRGTGLAERFASRADRDVREKRTEKIRFGWAKTAGTFLTGFLQKLGTGKKAQKKMSLC
ncbi:MAG: hypothetical protein NT067_04910 [Candidatus Diapherotrites archaeon]|nr:hypothetical protein [Candidatus Diapherotrites archaeon]